MKRLVLSVVVLVIAGTLLAYEFLGSEGPREEAPKTASHPPDVPRREVERRPSWTPREASHRLGDARDGTDATAVPATTGEIIARQQEQIAQLEEFVYGAREEFPPDAKGQDEDTVRQTLADALVQCEMGTAEVYADCEEPPCIAILDSPPKSFKPWDLGKCPAWSDMYGGGIFTSFRTAECEDGPVEMQLIAANIPGWWEADAVTVEQRNDRLNMRYRILRETFCDMRSPVSP